MCSVSPKQVSTISTILLLALQFTTTLCITIATAWKTNAKLPPYDINRFVGAQYTFTKVSDSSPKMCVVISLEDVETHKNYTENEKKVLLGVNLDTTNSATFYAAVLFQEGDPKCEGQPWLIIKGQPNTQIQSFITGIDFNYGSISIYHNGTNKDTGGKFEGELAIEDYIAQGLQVVEAEEDDILPGFENAVAAEAKSPVEESNGFTTSTSITDSSISSTSTTEIIIPATASSIELSFLTPLPLPDTSSITSNTTTSTTDESHKTSETTTPTATGAADGAAHGAPSAEDEKCEECLKAEAEKQCHVCEEGEEEGKEGEEKGEEEVATE